MAKARKSLWDDEIGKNEYLVGLRHCRSGYIQKDRVYPNGESGRCGCGIRERQ